MAASVSPAHLTPRHVAIIMDGNGRWASERGLNRTAGHRQGMKVAHACAVAARDCAIANLTLFAFSTDNWRRPANEIGELLELFDEGLRENFAKICAEDFRIRFIGDLSQFPRPIRATIDRLEDATAGNGGMNLTIALNYSGRWDITEAIRRLADTGHDLSNVAEGQIEEQLATAGLPAPDLVIRTSGEQRLSNFMLWQSAYAELYFTDVLWPDFSAAAFKEAVADYARRERRFGGVEIAAEAAKSKLANG